MEFTALKNRPKTEVKAKKSAGFFVKIIEKWRTDAQSRLMAAIILLAAGFLVIFLVNIVVSHIDFPTWAYEDKEVFPHYPPVGNDFRVGYYWPATYLVSSHLTAIGPNGSYPSNYPPLVALTSLPYALFDPMTAYAVHVALLVLANLACIWMAVWMARHFMLEGLGLSSLLVDVICAVLFFITAFYIFSSYFFAYSMERGNTDIFAMFYCMLAMVVLIKRPNAVWLQVILLSVAVHFKIYPIVLFALLHFKHGKKLILPSLAVNVAFLFVLGPKVAMAFIRSFSAGGEGVGIGNAWSNVGNHASYSFTMGIDTSGGEYLNTTFFTIWAITFLVPLLIWGFTAIAIVMKKYSASNAVLFFMVSVPLMNLLPTVSMDYKLVILSVVVVLLLALILKQFAQKFTWFDVVQLVLLLGVLLMLSRSYAYIDQSLVFIRNKYMWVLLLEIWMAVNILRSLGPLHKTKKEFIPPSTSG